MARREILKEKIAYGPALRLIRPPLRFGAEWRKDVVASWGTALQLLQKQLAQQYRYSWLGFFWAVMPSALTALVLMAGQRTSIQIDGAVIPAAFYGVFGLGMAQTFIEGMNASRTLFTRNQQLFSRYKAPLDGFIMAALLEVLLNTSIRMAVIVVVFIVFQVHPATATISLSAIGFIAVACQGIGFGLLCAPLNSLKSDFDNFFAVAPWIVFGVTPVFIPFNSESIFGSISQKIPLSNLFEATRAAAYGVGANPWAVIPGLALGLLMLGFGWIFCRLARPYVIERIL
jgi:lipopolysaccharide transport system permease protein